MTSVLDVVVIGGGITGSALGYELACRGLTVKVFDPDSSPQGATRFGYGGLPYWGATTPLMQQLCSDGIERHRQLSQELDYDTQFRDMSLVMPITPSQDPQALLQDYQKYAIPPHYLSPEETQAREPLLDPLGHIGSLEVQHAHILPSAAAVGFRQAMKQRGGSVQYERVTGLIRQGDRIQGVTTARQTYTSGMVIVCAGAWGRSLLAEAGFAVPLYFTHAELIEFSDCPWQLHTLVMEVGVKRFGLEAQSTLPERIPSWNQTTQELIPPILDAGVVQLRDGTLRVGQISRVCPGLDPVADPLTSATAMITATSALIPKVKELKGTWHHSLVAFTADALPLIGAVPGTEGLHLFSGFSNPLLVVPVLARRFAAQLAGSSAGDWILDGMQVNRFSQDADIRAKSR